MKVVHQTPMRVAYLNSHYPAISHTFITREVEALRSLGVEVHTFSVRPCDPADLNSERMKAEYEQTLVLLGGDARLWILAHLSLLVRHPASWVHGLRRALASGARTPRARLWQFFYFGEAVVLHHRMARMGLRHLHVHHANVGADVARLVCHMGNIIDGPGTWRWTLSLHGPAEFTMVQEWDIAAKIRDAAAVACISDYCRAQVMSIVSPDNWGKLDIVRMCADPVMFSPSPQPRTAHRRMRIVTVGRLVPEKGFGVLIKAVGELVDGGTEVELRIVGQGPMQEELAAQARQLGLEDRVQLMGSMGPAGVAEQLRWADVFVSPSFSEGLPVVLMEAMSTGLPVVGTQVGAIGELVTHGRSGFIAPPSRADALAAYLRDLSSDPELRARMGAAGRKKVLDEFVPASTGPAIHDFLARASPS